MDSGGREPAGEAVIPRGAHMVDVGAKPIVARRAVAEGLLRLKPATVRAIRSKNVPKGDVLEVARTAALLAAKNTPQILPLTHPIPLDGMDVEFSLVGPRVRARVTVRAHYRTGVEMEALTAAAVALLTIWDMVKPLEKDARGQYPTTRLDALRVLRKEKG